MTPLTHDIGTPPLTPSQGETRAGRSKNEQIAALRRTVAQLERGAIDAAPAHLSLGLPEVHRHLPGPGLPLGALHEVLAATYGDRPAAFGFVAALAACALRAQGKAGGGPLVFIAPRRCFADFGAPYGHGLRALGINLGRVLLVETQNDQDALWAMEEALRPEAAACAVAGTIDGKLDLTESRRLNLTASSSGALLAVLRSHAATGSSAAATRWRVAAAASGRDRFGALSGPRWNVTLERCRNGRPGHWLLEWNHVADRFHLAQVVADRAPAARPGQATGPSAVQRGLRRVG